MKPVVKGRLAIFHPQGFLDGNNVPYIITPSERDYTIKLQIDGALVSLKKVALFNKSGITLLVEILAQIRDRGKMAIGFCDYDKRKFELILSMFKNEMGFCLFESVEVAALFLSESHHDHKPKILIYSANNDQKNIMAIDLVEKGYEPIIAKDEMHFNNRKEGFDYAIRYTYLGIYDKKMGASIKGNAVIYTMKEYIDSDFAKYFDLHYHQYSLKVGFKFFVFDATKVASMNVHGVNFIARLSTAGAEYGATFAIAGLAKRRLTEKLRNDIEDSGVLLYETLSDLFADEELKKEIAAGGGTMVRRSPKKITRDLVKHAHSFVEAAITTIEIMAQVKAVKKSVELKPLALNLEESYAASLGFYGDLEGLMQLIFPKSLVKKSCAMLLEGDENNTEEVLDALGEFVNIIGGKSKTYLFAQDIEIMITLPRTFASLEEIREANEGKKGIQVDFDFEGHPFYFYLTSN